MPSWFLQIPLETSKTNQMINISTVLVVLTIHFIADFLLQSHWMAVNKSKQLRPLLIHVGVYSLTLFCVFWDPKWVLINGAAHLAVDAITSRVVSRLFAKKDYHWGFAVIGLDQLLHTSILLGTWVWLT